MSSKLMTPSTLVQTSALATVNARRQVEVHADQLIDALFTDLDDQLTPSSPQGLSAPTDELGDAVLSIDVWPMEESPAQPPASALAVAHDDMTVDFIPLDWDQDFQTAITPWQANPETIPSLGNPDDAGFQGRLMLCVACTSALSMALLWIGSQFTLRPPAQPSIAAVTQPTGPVASSPNNALGALPTTPVQQSQFADSMAQAHRRIQDLSAAATKTKVAALTQTPTAPLAANPSAPSAAPAQSTAAAHPAQRPTALPTTSPVPVATASTTTPQSQPAAPVAAAPVAAAPVAAAPTSAQPSPAQSSPAQSSPASPVTTTAAAPVAVAPASAVPQAAPASPPQVNPAVAAAQPSSPPIAATVSLAKTTAPLTSPGAPTQTLKGIVDLGAQSVVLVEQNGSTRSVKLGEVLDSSGLTLLKVDGQKAIVQRGDIVRSLDVGQKF